MTSVGDGAGVPSERVGGARGRSDTLPVDQEVDVIDLIRVIPGLQPAQRHLGEHDGLVPLDAGLLQEDDKSLLFNIETLFDRNGELQLAAGCRNASAFA